MGFCAEVLVFRKYLDILIDSISGEGHKELEIDNSTMETLKNIEAILRAAALSEIAYVAEQYKIAKMAMDLVINKYGAQLDGKFMSHEKFQHRKSVDRAVKIAKEKEKNKTAKTYPAKDEDLHIYC